MSRGKQLGPRVEVLYLHGLRRVQSDVDLKYRVITLGVVIASAPPSSS